MPIVGKTEDGRIVVGGLFELFNTLGIPLSVIFDFLVKEDLVPDLFGFVKEAKMKGWKDKTIYTRLSENIVDSFGKEYWKEVKNRLDIVILGGSVND